MEIILPKLDVGDGDGNNDGEGDNDCVSDGYDGVQMTNSAKSCFSAISKIKAN